MTQAPDPRASYVAEWNALDNAQKCARWAIIPERERALVRDLSGLTPQLIGLEGNRVEVETTYGERRRFWVGRSTGWKPCHLEVKLRTSSGGESAESTYKSVRVVTRGHYHGNTQR